MVMQRRSRERPMNESRQDVVVQTYVRGTRQVHRLEGEENVAGDPYMRRVSPGRGVCSACQAEFATDRRNFRQHQKSPKHQQALAAIAEREITKQQEE